MSLTLRYGARSDVGLLRDGNEDSLYAGPRLLAVADGMGGHAAGEVASAIAIASIAALDEDAPGADLISALRHAVASANGHLREMVSADSELEGMGTTLTALLWAGQRLGLVHIGDSRAYLLRDGVLAQITHDHTFVQSLVDEGRITPEEASTHPQRSWITRALDGRSAADPDVAVREVRLGDRYLLCTDGLSGVVSEDTIRESLGNGDPQDACDRLVELALRGGGPDNVTCIVADVVEADTADAAPIVAGAAADSRQPAAPSADHAAGRAALAQPRAVTDNGDRPDEEPPADVEARPRRRGMVVLLGLVVLVLAAAAAGVWAYVHAQFYVGPARGNVAIYRGLEGSVAGFRLSTVHQRSNVPLSALQEFAAERVRQGIPADGLGDARRIVESLRNQACTPTTPPTGKRPSPTPTPVASPWCEAVP